MTDTEFAALLRSKRTTTQEQEDARMRKHDKDDYTARERGAHFGV